MAAIGQFMVITDDDIRCIGCAVITTLYGIFCANDIVILSVLQFVEKAAYIVMGRRFSFSCIFISYSSFDGVADTLNLRHIGRICRIGTAYNGHHTASLFISNRLPQFFHHVIRRTGFRVIIVEYAFYFIHTDMTVGIFNGVSRSVNLGGIGIFCQVTLTYQTVDGTCRLLICLIITVIVECTIGQRCNPLILRTFFLLISRCRRCRNAREGTTYGRSNASSMCQVPGSHAIVTLGTIIILIGQVFQLCRYGYLNLVTFFDGVVIHLIYNLTQLCHVDGIIVFTAGCDPGNLTGNSIF